MDSESDMNTNDETCDHEMQSSKFGFSSDMVSDKSKAYVDESVPGSEVGDLDTEFEISLVEKCGT